MGGNKVKWCWPFIDIPSREMEIKLSKPKY